MLTIRNEQIQIFDSLREHRFVQSLADTFSSSHGGVENLRERLAGAVVRAKGYRILVDSDVEWFVALDLERGADWENQPGMEWGRAILENTDVDVTSRRHRLEKLLAQWDANDR